MIDGQAHQKLRYYNITYIYIYVLQEYINMIIH